MKDHQFHALPIAAVRSETADAISFALAVPEELSEDYRYRAGQHLVVRAVLDGEEVRRTYSISSDPADNQLWITVQLVDGGLFSAHAHSALKRGAALEAMRPAGRFVVPDDGGDGRIYLAIVAGSGITPADPGTMLTLSVVERSVRFLRISAVAAHSLQACS